MILGKVKGTIVSSEKNINISGARFLLIEKCNTKGETNNDFLVALDLIGAGNNEMVMVSQSTSARETPETKDKPIDAVIVGIIDLIDEYDNIVYRK
jgi:microcompartment protein CcmK/EutM